MKFFLPLACACALFAQPKSLLIEDMTWTEVRDAIAAGKTTAIYYAGSIEQNGPGMALGKHLFIAHYTAQRIAEELGNALVYPTMPFAPTGDPQEKTGHMRFAGSVNVSEQAYGLIARDVAMSAIAAGFKNVVLMSDHGGGGQEALKRVGAELDSIYKHKGIRIIYIPDLYFKEKEQMRAYLTEHKIPIDQHAGTDDTSEVMFIDQDHRWIRRDKLINGTGTDGVTGDQTRATRELGKMFVNYKVQDAVEQIRQLLKPSN
jgi:creatinine amidohydrolase/Fe(II)-dependent formamide hydrolase-like protein